MDPYKCGLSARHKNAPLLMIIHHHQTTKIANCKYYNQRNDIYHALTLICRAYICAKNLSFEFHISELNNF